MIELVTKYIKNGYRAFFYSSYTLYFRYLCDRLSCYIYSLNLRLNKKDISCHLSKWIILFSITCLIININVLTFSIYTSSLMILFLIKLRIKECIPINPQYCASNSIRIRRLNFPKSKAKYTAVIGEWAGSRKYMEDQVLLLPDEDIYGVFDGHGGCDMSEFMVNQFKPTFHKFKALHADDHSISGTVKTIYNSFRLLETQAFKRRICGGSTGTVVKIFADALICCSIGDSEAYAFGKNGQITQLSKPHTFTNFDEYSRYIKSHIDIDNTDPILYSNVMRTVTGLMPTRSLGDFKHKDKDHALLSEPDVVVKYIDWELVVIGSDGIFESLSVRRIIDELIDLKILNTNSDNRTYDLPVYDLSKNKIAALMKRLQEITTKTPDTFDKLKNIYNGDNCSIILIFREN